MKVILKGVELIGRIEGLDSLSVTHNRSGAGGVQTVAFSSEISFYDDGYALIKADLIDNTSGNYNSLSIEIFDDCCADAVFIGQINGTNIEWCDDDCYVTAQAVEVNNTEAQLKCLKSTLVHADKDANPNSPRNFKRQRFNQFTYCNEMRPQFIQDVLIINAITNVLLFKTTFFLFDIVLEVISFLVGLFGKITGIETSGITNVLNMTDILIDQMTDMITGCGRRHPTPLVSQYIQNVCDVCDIKFSSTILQQHPEYKNLSYLNAPVKKGHVNQTVLLEFFGINGSIDLIEDNLPLKTGTEFLDDLKPVFNAEYRIINNTLIFERKDYFNSSNTTWKSTGAMNIIDGICYSWDDTAKPPAAAKFEYSEDSVDTVGDESRIRYNDLVSWKAFSNQEGIKEVRLPFGTARTREDGIDRDVVSYWHNKIKPYPFVGNMLDLAQNFNESLIMQNGKTAFPKLLIWNDKSLSLNSTTKRQYAVSPYQTYQDNPSPYKPNYPMYFDSVRNNQVQNLYSFHAIDDPRINVQRNKTYEFTSTFICSDLDTFDIGKNLVLPEGFIGTMESVVINYSEKTLIIKGKV